MKLYKNQSGVGVVAVLLVLVVIAGVTGVAYYVSQSKDDGAQKQITQPAETSNKPSTEPVISDRLEQKPYVNAAEGFKINVPKGWKESKQPVEGALVLFESPDPLKVNANIHVSLDPESLDGLNLESYTEASIKVLEESPGYSLLSNEKISVTGNDARLIEYKNLEQGEESYTYQLIILKNNKAYIVTGGLSGSDWDKQKALIHESLLTFRFN